MSADNAASRRPGAERGAPAADGIIDSHQHFWRLARGDYHWLTPDLKPLYRDCLPADLEPLMHRYGVTATVAVQAAETEAETDFLLQLAERHGFIKGVVGWVDFTASDVAERIQRRAAHPKLKGLRPMVQWAEDGWLQRADVAAGIAALRQTTLSFDALVFSRQLPRLVTFMKAWPDLPVVIDHLAKPDVSADDWPHWSRHLKWLARNTNCCCKVSGLITECGERWTVAALHRYVDLLLEEFGSERLLWGSDWPVCRMAGGYDAWMAATERLFAGLTARERRNVFADTARRCYRLDS